MINSIKPQNPSQKEYIDLSKEFNKEWLGYNRYKQLMWYQETYWSISNNLLEQAKKYEILFNKRNKDGKGRKNKHK